VSLFDLTPEQVELQMTARTFAYEEVRPVARELDRVADPAAAYPVALVRRASELGLRTITLPSEYGGHSAGTVTQALVLEELCAGDVGFGMLLQHGWREGLALLTLATPEQRDRFLPVFVSDPTYVTSLAMTEPHSGSDHVIGYAGSLDAGPRTSAVRDGDSWVINGTKRWITNGNVARLIFALVRTDETVAWPEGVSMILVPNDAPGLRIGRIEDKLGARVNPNAELVFEDCRVPAENLLGEVDRGLDVMRRLAQGSILKEGVKSLGIARAAYEEARSWAMTRVQGGTTLVGHQAVRAALVTMATEIEASRALIWRAAAAVDASSSEAPALEGMAKVFAGEAAARVCVAALELHGSYGVLRENLVEKLVRDAVTMLHAFGGNHAVRERTAAFLLDIDLADPAGVV
jgi:alkylation response protein AidB-like acyl-CoA dehydrogenase